MYVNGDPETGKVFLTSGFQAPFQLSLPEQIDIASHFQSYATGGSILHIFLAEDLEPDQKKELITRILKNYPIQYISLTPVRSVCNKCGWSANGKYAVCPNCNSDDISIWSRPIGYFRPAVRKVKNVANLESEHKFWLDGRIEDLATREVVRDIEEIIDTL